MRIFILIISILFSISVTAQPYKIIGGVSDTATIPKVDSMDIKVISMKEFNAYLETINTTIQKQFNVSEIDKYQQVLKTIQSVYADADKKRRVK